MHTFGFGSRAIGTNDYVALPLGSVVFAEDFNVYFFPKGVAPQTLPTFWPVENFKLQNQDGKDISLNDFNLTNLFIVSVTISIAKLLERLYANISFVEESFIVDKYAILLLPYGIYVISVNITLNFKLLKVMCIRSN